MPDRVGVVLTLVVWIPMLVWFAALRPGLMSGDSLSVWEQANQGHWTDLHAPVYTAAMWVSARLSHDPSLLALAQSVFLAAGIVAVARAAHRLGAPLPAVVAATAVVAASPMVGSFSMSLWKDVPYAAAVLFVGARVMDLTSLRLVGIPGRGSAVIRSLALWLIVVSALRQNGILLALVLVVVLVIVLSEHRRSLALAGVAVVGCLLVAKVAVYPALGVTRADTHAALATFMHDIAAGIRVAPGRFESDDRRLLEAVAPVATWREESARFGCTSANWQFLPAFRWESVEGRADDYIRLWLEVVTEQPGRVLANRLCAGSIAWRPDTVGTVYTVSRGIDPNPFGLETTPLDARLDDLAVDVLDAADRPSVQWFLWRGPTWIYAAYGALGLAAFRRRQPALVLAGLPLVALQLSVLPVSPAQDARYMFAGTMLGLLLLPIVVSSAGEPTGAEPGADELVSLRPARRWRRSPPSDE